MKVQRYTYGSTNVAELQSQRSSAITPAEGAAAAAAPYTAIAGAAKNISDDITQVRIAQQEKQAAIEKERLRIASDRDKANLAAVKSGLTTARKQIEASGLPIEEQQTEWDKLTQQATDQISKTEDINQRSNFQTALRAHLYKEGTELQINSLKAEDKKVTMGMELTLDNQLDAGSLQEAADTLSLMIEGGRVSSERAVTLKNKIESRQTELQLEGFQEKLNEMIANDQDLEQVRTYLTKNPDPDEKMQKSKLAILKGAEATQDKFRERGRQRNLMSLELGVSDVVNRIEAGIPGDMPDNATIGNLIGEIVDSVDRGEIGGREGGKMIAKIQNAEIKKTARDGQRAEYNAQVSLTGSGNGGSQTHREFQDEDMQLAMSTQIAEVELKGLEWTEEDSEEFMLKFTAQRGMAGEKLFTTVKNAKGNPETIARIAPLIARLDEMPGYIRNLPVDELADLRTIHRRRLGNTPQDYMESARRYYEYQEKRKENPAFTQIADSKFSAGIKDDVGEDLLDEVFSENKYGYDQTWGWGFGGITNAATDDLTHKVAMQEFYREGLILKGADEDAAREWAKIQFSKSRPLNNMSGELAIDPYGIPGEGGKPFMGGKDLHDQFVREFSDEQFYWSQDGGTTFNLNSLDEIKTEVEKGALVSRVDEGDQFRGTVKTEPFRGQVFNFSNSRLGTAAGAYQYDVSVMGQPLIPSTNVTEKQKREMLIDGTISVDDFLSMQNFTTGVTFNNSDINATYANAGTRAEIKSNQDTINDLQDKIDTYKREIKIIEMGGSGDVAVVQQRITDATEVLKQAETRLVKLEGSIK